MSMPSPFPVSDPFDSGRMPPQAAQAEAAVLGSLILRPEGLRAARLDPSDFHDLRKRLAYRALFRLVAAGIAIDVVTLAEELERSGQLDEAGGLSALIELMEAVPHAEHLEHYASQVRDAAGRRRALSAATEAARRIHDGAPAEEIASLLELGREGLALRAEALLTRTVADVPAERLEWLWPGRIPLGKLTLLAGDPGLGKSFLTLDVAARVSCGRGWPDASWIREERSDGRSAICDPRSASAGDVILFGAEDDLGDTVRPRLEAAGADLNRIVAVEGVRDASGPRTFSLSNDLPRLEAVLESRPETRLVVIDPITAYSCGVDSHKNADVRAMLAPLAELAARHKVAVLAVTHLNKAPGSKALYRAMGSLAYVAAARLAWLVAQDKDDAERRLLLPVKNNLAARNNGLAYRLVPPGVIEWDDEPIDVEADEALAPQRDESCAPARRRADEWLEQTLANGPLPAAEVNRLAEQAGLSNKQIRDSRRRLGVRSHKDASHWVLQLPGSSPQGATPLTTDGHDELCDQLFDIDEISGLVDPFPLA